MSDFDYKYCYMPLRPRDSKILGQIKILANKLRAISVNAAKENDDCKVITNESCHVNVHHADQYCPKSEKMDTIAVFCSEKITCPSASDVHKEILKDPRFSPSDRKLVSNIAAKRGKFQDRENLACIERVGNEALCQEKPTCKIHREYGFGKDCKVEQNLKDDKIDKLVILEIILRLTYRQDFDPLTLSNNKKRRLLYNITSLSQDDRVRIYESYFNQSKTFDLLQQLDTISRALLSKEDYITEEDMTKLIDSHHVDKEKINVNLLTTLFNAASAALSMVVPWYVYFLAFPSGRQLLRNKVLNPESSGYIFIVSLLISKEKIKNNYFFDIDATIPPEYSEQFYSISATLSSLLLRKLSTNLEKT